MNEHGGGGPCPLDESAGRSQAPLADEDIEALLSGRPGPAGSEAVMETLAAASRSGLPHELTGYDQVRRAFEDAGRRHAGVRSGFLVRRAVSRLAAMRIGSAAAAVAVLSVVGIVTAAAVTELPAPVQQVVHNVFGPVGVPGPPNPVSSARPSASGTPKVPASSTGGNSTPSPGTTAGRGYTTPGQSSASIDLCKTYEHGRNNDNDHGLTPEQFKQLTQLAGGSKLIDSYCGVVLNRTKDGGDGSRSTGSDDNHHRGNGTGGTGHSMDGDGSGGDARHDAGGGDHPKRRQSERSPSR